MDEIIIPFNELFGYMAIVVVLALVMRVTYGRSEFSTMEDRRLWTQVILLYGIMGGLCLQFPDMAYVCAFIWLGGNILSVFVPCMREHAT